MIESKLTSFREKVFNLELRDDYKSKAYNRGFNDHLSSLFICESEILQSGDHLISDKLSFNKTRYYEAEATILEKLDDIDSNDESLFSNLEDQLYTKIEGELGAFKDSSEQIEMIIDHTVQSLLLSARFNCFESARYHRNPWNSAANILFESNYLFKPIFDSDEFSEVKRLKKHRGLSQDMVESEIYVAAKARSNSITFGSFKDYVKLRSQILNYLDEKAGQLNIPVKFEDLFSDLQSMNLDLSVGEVKSKIIYPLKSFGKIGSCKEGYFMLRTCDDFARSYESHLNRWYGYFRTLEAHKWAAEKYDSSCYDFSQHKISE